MLAFINQNNAFIVKQGICLDLKNLGAASNIKLNTTWYQNISFTQNEYNKRSKLV